AFINASTLVVVAVYLGIEAIKRLYHPQEIISDVVIYLAILGALANGISVLLLKSDAEKNMNIKSAYLHLVTDMLTSVAVLFGGLMMKFYAIFWIDALLTLLISIYLIYLSWDILISALKVLMLFSPSHLNIIDIEKEILQMEGIKNIHHVHLWQLNDHDCHFEAHIQFKKDIRLSEFDQKCQQVERILKEKFHISHSNLQPEFFRDDHKEIIIQD
ncbi:MAG: cation diffusion facilitator family transporter, partial [Lutibacter sp.]|nr:cation diffusion facilitator family transporter [Lutibacter sp.]